MKKKSLIQILVIAALLTPSFGLEAVCQSREQARPERPPQRNTRDKIQPPDTDKQGQEPLAESPEEVLRKTIAMLSERLENLTAEIRRLRKQAERSSESIELLLAEERLARVEERLENALAGKAQLDAQEQQLLQRMKNPRQELIGRPVLRPDEAEAAVRAQLQNALDFTHSQQSYQQSRITELQAQSQRLKARVTELMKKLEPAQEK